MKKALIAVAAMAAALGAASAANATKTLTLTAPAVDGSFSGTFQDTALPLGDFDEVFTFQMPTGLAGGTISTNFTTDLMNNIDFSTVTLNGHKFDLSPTGQVEMGSLVGLPVTAGTQTLEVVGKSGGNGSFAGTLSFELSSAPEPASWGLMILGFGGIGAAARLRRMRPALAAA